MNPRNSKDNISNKKECGNKEIKKQLAKKLIKDDRYIREFSTKTASFHVPHDSCFEKVEVRKRKTELLSNLRVYKSVPPSLTNITETITENKKKLKFTGEDISHTGLSYFSQATEVTESTYSETTTRFTTISAKTSYIVSDLNLLIELVKTYKDGRFVYLTYAVPKSSPLFTPYSLIEVPFDKVDRSQYYAVSRQGVTFWSDTENHFTKLTEWKFEYQRYCYLMNIKLFKTFRIWKGFKVWRKTLQWQKYETAKAFIRDNLFIAIPHLGKALLQLQSKLSAVKELKFTDVNIKENFYLFYFIESQMTSYENTRNLLLKFRNDIKITLFHACYKALIDKNFSPEDEIFLFPSVKKMKENLTSIDQANKRRYCVLLTNFLSTCDYMIITCIYNLVKNAFDDYAKLLLLHDECAPTDDEIRNNQNLDVQLEKPRQNITKLPFIKSELALKAEVIDVDPSRQVTINIINQICDLILQTAFDIKRYQNDPFFKLYTEPSIMGVQQEKLGGDPPNLNFLFEMDDDYNKNRQLIPEYINRAYDKLLIYLERFEPIRKDFEIDLKTEPKEIAKVTDVATLRKFCERYVVEVENLEGILPEVNLGLFILKQATFKEDITPVCKKLVSVLDTHIPVLAIERVQQTIEKLGDLMVKLQEVPEDISSWVAYLRFTATAQNIIDEITEELKYAYDLFILMKDYDTFVDIAEKDQYLDTEELIQTLQNVLNEKLEERPDFIQKLSDCLQVAYAKVFEDIDDVNHKIVEPWLILETSDRNAINETLSSLYDRVIQGQSLTQDYRKFQREFRIDLTRVEVIDLTMQEVKLRQLLWSSADEWKDALETWTTQNFHTLDLEDLTAVNQRILKNCMVLEKYVPPNTIVPRLQDSAEQFKEKLHVIGYLRNPALKTRHWLRIEQVLGRKLLSDESLCLQVFEDANAFSSELSDQIMEIAGQASAEAGLETLLKKIENLWKDFELSIVPHRDSKNVYILAGVEEIQTNLDESNININTIAASRHVGPIKPRVDEWLRMLDLFALVFDEWVQCQQQWIYLEVIFSAPDIQRQLPNEARMFLSVDKTWKDLMRKAYKMPLAMPTMTEPGVLDKLKNCNLLLDKIMKSLEVYLEIKRVAFPRFYFLSNDELLEILAQTRNPHAVQPHLRKCFDAINQLEFGLMKGRDGAPDKMTNDILGMVSPENEKVQFGVGLKARGSVEDWLGKVEEAMVTALRRCMRFALQLYPTKDRAEWFQEHPNQIVLTVSQQQWASNVHAILDSSDPDLKKNEKMSAFDHQLTLDLQKLASIARSDISKLVRKVLCALITIDVHAKDTVLKLVENKVTNSSDFNWLKMIRYYWDQETNTMLAKMSSACLPYYYEYLGAGGVLVITPLTDRCYLCLMGALQMDLGGAPAGPAGTGKTETTKDLAKALAKQCVVFNCSEGLDYKMMGRFFSGLAQCGAWCCFDEFNRIDIEVLSVIAQQLITIRSAKAMRLKRFFFEGREIKLNQSCAPFITMNPGYAGRTELPDNLKALFRPIAMMVPDYALIAEVILYSEGFVNSKILAQKMVQMYKLCSEQLSQQDHYDFGMRAVKSVLVMAGALKRSMPDQLEDITLIAALRDSNLPKFLAEDAKLFRGILNDLFPLIELPVAVYGNLQKSIEFCMQEHNLQPVPDLITKTVQLYETMCVRWGVMLVGTTGGGKSTVLNTLACALSKLKEDGVADPNFRHVRIQSINPKSVSLDELYGAVNSQTLEWKDGLIGLAVRSAVNVTIEEHQWIVFDGPVDAVWIESMNTVLDDNKMLCLASSERIKLTAWVHLIFEVQDLAQASPATVSRCGMVYVDPGELGWLPLVQSWRTTIPTKILSEELNRFLYNLYETYFEKILKYSLKHGKFSFHQVEVSKLSMMFTLIASLIEKAGNLNSNDPEDSHDLLIKLFFWCALWSMGSNFLEQAREKLEIYVRSLIPEGIAMPEETLWECRINITDGNWESYAKLVPAFKFNPNIPYFELLVQTTDTARFGYIAELLFEKKRPVMFTGDTGVGKSILAKSILDTLSEGITIPVVVNFSAQTNSKQTQETIEARLEKRKKTLLGAPIGKMIIFFIDDVNMPALDTYGSQPPIELLRQFLDYGGLFDRDKCYWKDIVDVVLGAACAPPGGGRNALTARFVRHFGLLQLPLPSTKTLTSIFSSIMGGFLADFVAVIRPLASPMVEAAVLLYNRIAEELLPTPAKSHYIFNLRDLSKLIQGILQAESGNYVLKPQILRLFYHEAMRVFHDRLINEEDKSYFIHLMDEISIKYFEAPIVKKGEVLIFGDFMIFGQAKMDRVYEEIKDMEKLESILMDYLDDYNGLVGTEMNLILFQDAIEHVVRLARILRSERGNGLLVGLSGMGKQSLSRLAAHINGYRCSSIELCRGYDRTSFADDLRKMYFAAGVTNIPTVFLITDTQIVKEDFLEDINNILNSGEVPNLFEGDDYEKVILGARQFCLDIRKKDCTRDDIFNFFINRVRANLHVVMCMSPVGDAFRRRCRMFPSIVNCCTIDWFVKWPPEALYSVAFGALADIEKEQREHISNICVSMHEVVEDTSLRFFKEMKRRYYTTPSSYLELLKLYKLLLKSRTEIIIAKRTRIANGLNKLLESNELVAVMGEELKQFQPIIESSSANMKQLLLKLDKDTQAADIVRTNVTRDEAEAKIIKDETMAIAEDAAKDLEIAMPALRGANDALKALNKSDVNELRSFLVPPKLVQFVMEPICIMLGVKPDWASAKQVMADINFLKRLVEFDKEHISEKTLTRLKYYVNHKDFDPAKVEKVSKVCKSMCLWVRAIDEFAKVYKVVEPKIKRHQAAAAELKAIMLVLKQKQAELAEIEGKIQSLKDMIDVKNQEFQVIQDNVNLTSARLNRAGRLTSALSDEEIRWKNTVKILTDELWAIPGDTLVASACVAYLGAFPINYRQELSTSWGQKCRDLNIPSSKDFSFLEVLGDSYEIRSWNMFGLPKDETSIENGIIVMKAFRWPLMIDPQEQANQWIRNMEKEKGLRIIKMTDANLLKVLEICIRQGFPLLIEELDETIDPTLGPVLSRDIKSQAGRLLIRLGDTEVDYDANFKLYMTTKLSNPHYLPEICIKVTLVNFLVTASGLEDQLLAEVVAIELPELEKQRSDLIVRINSDKQQLLALEDKVLKLLYNSQGNILDDEELVETLNESKETSAIIAARLVDTEKTEAVITIKREAYRKLAIRGATLFFCVSSLGDIDSMYQNSLTYFTQIFKSVIQLNQEAFPTLDLRLENLMNGENYSIYQNISRGLFEKHKLIFSFMLSTAICKENGILSNDEYQFLLRGPVGTQNIPPNKSKFLNEYQWKCVYILETSFSNFKGFSNDLLTSTISLQVGDFQLDFTFDGNDTPIIDWNTQLELFEKLVFIRVLRPEKLVYAIGAYVRTTIGKAFTEIPKNNSLSAIFSETSSITPLVFILSTGSDPMAALLRFADSLKYREKLFSISLGQGQGPAAASLIEKGRIVGNWVFLQNCHLATSWMPTMEKIIRDIALFVTPTHADFRIFLSSVPTKSFPVSVLQNSLKLTNEPPKGLRANMIRALTDMNSAFFEVHNLGDRWHKMVFGLCMFHAVVLERRKFGPLGWNILYDFSESDRECGLKVLEMYCECELPCEEIQWPSLEYINGEITWGGRVTDYWDQRCLKSILKIFSSSAILKENYAYSTSGIYKCPEGISKLEDYLKYVQELPMFDSPDIFGMHENANIVFESKETMFVLDTLLECSSTTVDTASAESKESPDSICLSMIKYISDSLAKNVSSDYMFPKLMELDAKGRVPSLTTVLLQEMERYNKLLKVVHSSLVDLEKAIKGFIVMSESLEAIYNTFLINQVPALWASKGFLSVKSLAPWIIDFQFRIDYMQTWVVQGEPRSNWISGLFFPQSFLTGTLQTHSRRYNLPIDSLKIDFTILPTILLQKSIYERHLAGVTESPALYANLDYPDEGVYVHGLYMEGGRWDSTAGGLCDANYGELMPIMPIIWLKPCLTVEPKGRYESPLYKTQVRAGVLSTTGHSTNFVLTVLLDSLKPPEFWILNGTALFTMTAE